MPRATSLVSLSQKWLTSAWYAGRVRGRRIKPHIKPSIPNSLAPLCTPRRYLSTPAQTDAVDAFGDSDEAPRHCKKLHPTHPDPNPVAEACQKTNSRGCCCLEDRILTGLQSRVQKKFDGHHARAGVNTLLHMQKFINVYNYVDTV